jgi:hypothetical protein
MRPKIGPVPRQLDTSFSLPGDEDQKSIALDGALAERGSARNLSTNVPNRRAKHRLVPSPVAPDFRPERGAKSRASNQTQLSFLVDFW